MGNRGILHNDSNEIVKQWAHKSWVICLLQFRGIRRPRPFSKANYSELFFLDEASAFSAGHRPCAFCQRERNAEFHTAWLDANVTADSQAPRTMKMLDHTLHSERAIRGGGKRTVEKTISELPCGTIFSHAASAYLVTKGGFLPWSFKGYGLPILLPAATVFTVLTPWSVVRAFSGGFQPPVHVSASGQTGHIPSL